MRPTTTALQLNETASSAETSTSFWILVFQHRAAVFVKGAGVIDRRLRVERAEAGVEVVEPRIDQLHGQHWHTQPLSDPLVAPHVAPEPIPREEGLAAEQGVASPLEVHRFRQRLDHESAFFGPALEMGLSPWRTPNRNRAGRKRSW